MLILTAPSTPMPQQGMSSYRHKVRKLLNRAQRMTGIAQTKSWYTEGKKSCRSIRPSRLLLLILGQTLESLFDILVINNDTAL